MPCKSEFRRRNIFELYIEEVVEACHRLKGGKLPKEKLKEQLQKIASKRTGGQKTDEALGRDGGGPEGLPFSIIVTPEGTEGDAPVIADDERSEPAPPEEAREDEPPAGPVEMDEPAAPLAKVKKKTAKAKQQSGARSDRRQKTVPRSQKPATRSKRNKK